MKRQKILFVSHCVLNTAAKVARAADVGANEEQSRRSLLIRAAEADIQLVQLPCPELTLYGTKRWGHTKEQFDNPFFREHCEVILKPILAQLAAYLEEPQRFEVLGIVGIDGSPSCGVNRSCSAPWGGEFSGRSDLADTLHSVTYSDTQGVFIEKLQEMLQQQKIEIPMVSLDRNPDSPMMNLLK